MEITEEQRKRLGEIMFSSTCGTCNQGLKEMREILEEIDNAN